MEQHVIKYDETNRGDILRMTKPVPDLARGFLTGDLVRLIERTQEGVKVENRYGETVEFVFNCGAAYLEPTEWKNDFPDQQPVAKAG